MTERLLSVAGLFAGIGGLEHGLHRAGHETVLLCENDPTAAAVLRQHFASVPIHDDVKTLAELPNGTTLLTAGFPCQDLSQAGKTVGIVGPRSGLIAEVFRLLTRQRVPWVLLENVPFMLQLDAGSAMRVITSTLENLGYSWAYRVVDTRAFGLPQRRRRVFLVASHMADPREVLFADEGLGDLEAPPEYPGSSRGFYWTEGTRGLGWAKGAIPTLKGGSTLGIPSPPALMIRGRFGTPDIRDAERLQGFPENWTRIAERAGRPSLRWKLVGNAVSVPAAAWIGRRLKSPGRVLEYRLRGLSANDKWPRAAWNVGEGRTSVDASEWPLVRIGDSAEKFLKHPLRPLSKKATAGFYSRAKVAKLKFEDGFLPAVKRYLDSLADE